MELVDPQANYPRSRVLSKSWPLGYEAKPPSYIAVQFYGQQAMMPPIVTSRMDSWQAKSKPPLEAQQEAADYLWELYDKDLLDVKLPEPLASSLQEIRNKKAWMMPVGMEKLEEEWGEFVQEVKGTVPESKLEPFHLDSRLDKPFNHRQWELLLGLLKWPSIPIEKFLAYSALKLDGRLSYQKANPTQPKEDRKKDLLPYETAAAKRIFYEA